MIDLRVSPFSHYWWTSGSRQWLSMDNKSIRCEVYGKLYNVFCVYIYSIYFVFMYICIHKYIFIFINIYNI